MPSTVVRSQAELYSQREKLVSSYNELLEAFSDKELRSVGNYAIDHLIGKGSFGKVYLAEHKLIKGAKVVLKSADKNDQNLAREIHHHRQFSHPHIIGLYEVIITESLVWLVLEYCPGDELYNHLIQSGPLEPSLVQKIFAQLVGAVSYVHSKSCVHRDLKLENVLLDKHGNVKLCDFGFTREYEGKSSYLQTWCGTVCYSAPEMIKGEKYAAEKADIWSLGIILFALLTGELPFDDDDETVTKQQILKEEPKYPDAIPQPARELINLMLSKRPLLRPSLADVLTNPWLGEHAPQQQANLKLQQPPVFSTPLEKDVLQRMRSAGVDIDKVIENVLAQRCDPLAGWWALLLEKEERKAKRKERKRKEAEAKALRRISAASARLEPMAPTIMESVEEGHSTIDLHEERGREKQRSSGFPPLQTDLLDSPGSPSMTQELPLPPKIARRASSSRRRSQLGAPREGRRRNSQLQPSIQNPALLQPESAQKKRRRYNGPFFSQLSNIKHWFKESTRRGKSPGEQQHDSKRLSPASAATAGPNKLRRNPPNSSGRGTASPQAESSSRPLTTRPRVSTTTSTSSGGRRLSHSPSPLTPSSSYRRTSGLRGRKSTSSSVSSIRSFHARNPSHSKASSTSSASVISPATASKTLTAISQARKPSPHTSVKVLPGTPTSSSFPSNIRVVRGPPPALNLSPLPGSAGGDGGDSPSSPYHLDNPFMGAAPASPGLVFARRRRSPFKGPMLGPGLSSTRRKSDASTGDRRASKLVIAEEDEEEEDDGFEEVDETEAFGPLDEALASGVSARLDDFAAQQASASGDAQPEAPTEEVARKASSMLSDIREDADSTAAADRSSLKSAAPTHEDSERPTSKPAT